MCGITGVIALPGGAPPSDHQLAVMCDTLVHRGPDEDGRSIEGRVALGMRRLSIIDVKGAHQPLWNEDRTVRVVFNGEIYNFRELRRELEARGHVFTTSGDGEVIPHLWEEHGPGFPRKLNGMFAFALHDSRLGRVVLGRDHLGIKPLYYAHAGDHVVFGSEIKAILASGLVERSLDIDALGEFLSWEYVPAPRTLLRGVRKLPPATSLDVDLSAGTLRLDTWWDVPRSHEAVYRSDRDWEDAVDEKIQVAVQRQLVSDVPLGAFLSGGVDSSLVVAAMGEARTFTIGFQDPSYTEVEWARRVAATLGVGHRVEIIEPAAVELFERLMPFMDDPIGDFSIFPTYLVSRLAREEVTVVLSGDGGDELFGGYETYLAQQKARAWRRIPAFIREQIAEPCIRNLRPRREKKGLVNKAKRFVEGLEHDEALEHARWRLFVGEALRRELFTPEAGRALVTGTGAHIHALGAAAAGLGELDRQLYVDVKSYLSDNCLVKVDRMSMACSLETRVPLLDVELVELAFQVPHALKVHRGETKVLLKRVAARHVPPECVYRQKQGFSIPIKTWLGTSFRPILEELLSPTRLSAEGLFNIATVDRLKTEHLSGRANHSHVLWSLLVFQDWRRRWAV